MSADRADGGNEAPICWCDGDPSCHNLSAEGEYGLCSECRRLGHRALPALPFSLVEATQSGRTQEGER